MDPDELLTIREAADLLNVHPDTLRRWEKAGRLVPLRTPTGHRRYRRGDLALPAPKQPADDSAAAEARARRLKEERPRVPMSEFRAAARANAQSRERLSTPEETEAMTPDSGPKVYDWDKGSFRAGTYPPLHRSLSQLRAAAAYYPTGALKQDPATLAIAVRTAAAASGDDAWGIMTVDRGGYMANYEMVAHWPDIDRPGEHLSTETIAAFVDGERRIKLDAYMRAADHISRCPACAQEVEDQSRARAARGRSWRSGPRAASASPQSRGGRRGDER